MKILRRTLPKGSKLSYMAMYEGIKIFFANSMNESRPEVNGAAVGTSLAISDEGTGFVKELVGLLLPVSPSEGGQFLPVPEDSDTEAVRIARAGALLTYASHGFQDTRGREEASRAVSVWLDKERSRPVQAILHETHASFLKQGGNEL